MSADHIALNRFGLGARPGEPLRLGDARAWLTAQLDGGSPDLVGATPTPEEVSDLFQRHQSATRSRDRAAQQAAAQEIRRSSSREVAGVLSTRVASERPFVERWIAFWSNHLCISVSSGVRTALLAGSYERDVIRRHALGRYSDMLLASARHPAMLLYLNNAQSIGPSSPAARRGGRGNRPQANARRGLNENYARELLELHTVGVRGGYAQEDVESLARILTGWTLAGVGGPLAPAGGSVGFRFLEPTHEPGRKSVLGRTYGEGEEGGIQVIRDLATLPATARHVAGKLATHFIADAPPRSAVDAIADRWLETEGDLREVALTLISRDEAWASEHRKFRTPQDWLVALLRALDAREAPPNLAQSLRQLRHPLWAPTSPKGFGDLTGDWADPDALMSRAELARSVADASARARGRRGGDPRPLSTVLPLEADDPLRTLLADGSIAYPERLALVFAGPAFQWR